MPPTTAWLRWNGISPAAGVLGNCNGGIAAAAAALLAADMALALDPHVAIAHGGGAVALRPNRITCGGDRRARH
jgi:hypothetical protein